jgi:hypothetical protein
MSSSCPSHYMLKQAAVSFFARIPMSTSPSPPNSPDNTPEAQEYFVYYSDRRHETQGRTTIISKHLHDWRMRERLKTVSVCLVLCLNIGV